MSWMQQWGDTTFPYLVSLPPGPRIAGMWNNKQWPMSPKGNQSWLFIGRTDAEAEAPILWPPDVKNWLIGKDPDAEKDWGQEEKGMAEDEMAGWHYWHDGHESEQALGAGDEQGSLMCCSPWGRKESDRTECLNWTEWVCCWRRKWQPTPGRLLSTGSQRVGHNLATKQ